LELLRIADEEAEHLRLLIDDALEMAQLDTSNIKVQLERCSVPQLVREIVTSMQKEIDTRPVDVVGDGDQQAALIDRRLIKVAIRQLMDNAVKYSAPGSPLQIALRRGNDGSMTVDVTDHGPGITPADQSHIFERFWRGPALRKQIPGSGLGLSIARGIARAHNGDLSVMSRPGETTFSLTLPMQGETLERGPHSRR
jgi:signal transduction histidine kinase